MPGVSKGEVWLVDFGMKYGERDLTQRRKGAETQGFRLPGTITRRVSQIRPGLLSPALCPLGLCLLASLR